MSVALTLPDPPIVVVVLVPLVRVTIPRADTVEECPEPVPISVVAVPREAVVVTSSALTAMLAGDPSVTPMSVVALPELAIVVMSLAEALIRIVPPPEARGFAPPPAIPPPPAVGDLSGAGSVGPVPRAHPLAAGMADTCPVGTTIAGAADAAAFGDTMAGVTPIARTVASRHSRAAEIRPVSLAMPGSAEAQCPSEPGRFANLRFKSW